MEIQTELIAIGRQNRPRTKLQPTSVTVHNTANTSAGANAARHSRFVRNTGFYQIGDKKQWVSWHYTVDDVSIIRQLPDNEAAYHAKSGNASSLGVEVCMNSDIDQAKADDNAARLVAHLLGKHGLTDAAVKRHKDWTGKNCPQLLIPRWNDFLALVRKYVAQGANITDAAAGAGMESAADGALESAAAPEASGASIVEFEIDHDMLAAALTAASPD